MSVYKFGSDCALTPLKGSKIGKQVENRRSASKTKAGFVGIAADALGVLLERAFFKNAVPMSFTSCFMSGLLS
jgi:hypothetical protein